MRGVRYCLMVPVDCKDPTSICLNCWPSAAFPCQLLNLLTSSIIVYRTNSPSASRDRALTAINAPPIYRTHTAPSTNHASQTPETAGSFRRYAKQTSSQLTGYVTRREAISMRSMPPLIQERLKSVATQERETWTSDCI